MRHAFFILSLLAILTITVRAQPVVNDNWLVNQGFEQAGDNGDPAGWHIDKLAPGLTTSLDTQTRRSGAQSMRAHFEGSKVRNAQTNLGFTVYKIIPNRFVPGRKYTVSGYVKLRGMNRGWAAMEIFQYPAPFPADARARSEKIRGDTDWTRIVMTFTAREKIANLMVRLLAYGYPDTLDGDVWFDDLKVEEGEVATDYVDWVDTEFYPFSGRPPDHFAVDFNYRASTDITTPHTEPSRGLTARPLSAIFMAHPRYMRWPADIAQRSDIAVDSVALNGRKTGYKQVHVNECIEVMHQRLKADPRVIIMHPDAFELLIKRDRKNILDRVRAGGGLVLFDLINTHLTLVKDQISDATPITDDDGKAKRYRGRLLPYTLGKGRVVTIGREPMPQTNTYLRELYADNMVLASYLAGGFDPADVEVTPSTPLIAAGQPWSVTCQSAEPAAKWRVRLRTVHRTHQYSTDFQSAELIAEQMLAGSREVVATMPALASGSYMVEATALDASGRVIGWAMRALPCDGPVRIDSLNATDARIGKDGQLRATALVMCGKAAPRRLTLAAEARDTNGRVLAVAEPRVVELATGRNDLPIELTVPATTTPQVRLHVTLLRDNAQVAQKEMRFSGEVMLRDPDYRFAFYSDHAPGMVAIGADTVVARDPAATDLGLRLYPWIDVVPYGRTTRVLHEDDVITSPDTRKRLGAAVKAYLRDIAPFRSTAAITIDEWAFDEMREQDDEENLAYFRDYLQGIYKSIDSLNNAWDVSLKSFDEVTLAMCDASHVRYDGAPLVRWADVHAMKEDAVDNYFRTLIEAGLEVEPNFRPGLSGTRDTTGVNGLDWWRLMKLPSSVAAYSGLQLRLQESFAKPGSKLYRWSYVTRENHPRGLFDPWWWLFKGHDGYLHYGGHHSNLFQPCYAPHPAALTVRDQIAAIRRGPAKLLRGAVREDNGIGLLYAPASYRVQRGRRLIGKTGDLNLNDVGLSLDAALADSGLDSKWYSYEQLADGVITPQRVKAFFLPASCAMSDGEVDALRRYVRDGGVVIADTRPATYDQRLRLRKSGALDDVFGLAPVGAGDTLDKATAHLPSGEALSASAGEWDLKLTNDAKAHGTIEAKGKSAPAIIVHSFGRGRAILLNFVVSDYWQQRGAGVGGEISEESGQATAAPLRTLLRDLLHTHAQVTPPATILGTDDHPLPQSRLYTYRDGGATYFGYIQHYGKSYDSLLTSPAQLRLAESGRLYDVLEHRDMGRQPTHDLTVKESHARLFAMMPYEIGAVNVTVTPRVTRGGFVQIGAQVPGASERHVFHVTITNPSGEVHSWNQFTMDGPSGAAQESRHIALNAPTGRWAVTVREVVSGKSAAASFDVMESGR